MMPSMQCIEAGLSESPDIHIAMARLRQAQASAANIGICAKYYRVVVFDNPASRCLGLWLWAFEFAG